MARDELAPADPGGIVDRSANPSQLGPDADTPGLDGGEYQYWLRDGVTPYRTLDNADAHVFSTNPQENGWHINHMVDRSKLWPSSPGEIAGMIGGRHRLTEPTIGAAPLDPGPDEDFAPVEPPDLIEADSQGDVPPDPPTGNAGPPLDDLPEGGMNEQQIRDAGLRIDVPYDDPMPVALKYKDTGQKAWTPPPGWRQGASPIDEQLATALGVPRDLGQAQGGTDDSGSSGVPESGA